MLRGYSFVMLIIGITGTIGAGKGTVVDYLVKNEGFSHFSVRAYLTDLIKKDGNEVNRDFMVEKANNLRSKFGPSYIVDQLFELAFKKGGSCIIESIRSPGEIESLRKKGEFYLLAIDANPKLRYERVFLRGSETDKISFEEFIENENREMTSNDPNKQNLKKCIAMSDFLINNDGNLEELYDQTKKIIEKIK